VRRPSDTFTVDECRLELIDAESEAYYYDLAVGTETLTVLPFALPERAALLNLLLEAENMVDRLDAGSDVFRKSVSRARGHLAEGLAALAAAGASNRARVTAVGHAHIDTAWMWTLAQTRRKIVRSWSTALRLMERYPNYHFVCSQPQHYRWIEEDEPDLYRQVVARIKEGRWEPAGAMWVEPDANLTSGESLVRQLMYGQRFLRERFAKTCGVLWLPDAFGYSGALPQLMRSAGVHTFVTIKLSWNTTNRMPHDTFRWRGLDGTEVLAYFMTAGADWRPLDYMEDPYPATRAAATYNGNFSVKEVLGSWVRYRDKTLNTETLYAFGWGDGGGGPTEQMLEYADRLRAYPGLPAVSQGNAEQFLKRLGDRVLRDPRTPIWEGELYLEYHRGTYTSQARAKWDNRRADHLLRDAELWCAWAAVLGHANSSWNERLTRCWEDVLLNQFHDILPGSSIGDVYKDQRRQHAAVIATAGGVLAEAQDELVGQIDADIPALAIFNASPFARNETLEVRLPPGTPSGVVLGSAPGHSVLTQSLPGGTDRRVVLVAGVTVPALGYTTIPLIAGDVPPSRPDLTVSERVIENRFFRLELDDRGRFASLFDKRHSREVLAPGGGGNRLLAFEDKPISYDAWDIDEFYTDKCREIDDVQSLQIIEAGPVRAGVEITRVFGMSQIRQRILLHVDTPRIDIQTEIDWQQRQVLVKAAFPLAVHASQATYECAFGYVQRPTHRNTSWDAARFEVAGHQWADLSETGYGVSLLNDGKYGHDCLGNVLRLTLLKSAISPDPLADEGSHSFSYALFPHGRDWTIEDTVRAGVAFNMPVYARLVPGEGRLLPPARSLVTCDSAHAVVDTVKPAEDGHGLIVRVYDCANRRGRVTLAFAHPIASAQPVTILEEPDTATDLQITDDTLRFDLQPFQVRSFRVVLRQPQA
jgi:alpha-mannosidase